MLLRLKRRQRDLDQERRRIEEQIRRSVQTELNLLWRRVLADVRRLDQQRPESPHPRRLRKAAFTGGSEMWQAFQTRLEQRLQAEITAGALSLNQIHNAHFARAAGAGWQPVEFTPEDLLAIHTAPTPNGAGRIGELIVDRLPERGYDGSMRATKITKEIRDQVGQAVANWYSEPETTLEDLVAELHPLFTTVRSQRIAITETTFLNSRVTQTRMQKIGITSWTWDTNRDEIVCKGCRSLHGKKFKVGDPMPPLHPNCRCSPVEDLPVMAPIAAPAPPDPDKLAAMLPAGFNSGHYASMKAKATKKTLTGDEIANLKAYALLQHHKIPGWINDAEQGQIIPGVPKKAKAVAQLAPEPAPELTAVLEAPAPPAGPPKISSEQEAQELIKKYSEPEDMSPEEMQALLDFAAEHQIPGLADTVAYWQKENAAGYQQLKPLLQQAGKTSIEDSEYPLSQGDYQKAQDYYNAIGDSYMVDKTQEWKEALEEYELTRWSLARKIGKAKGEFLPIPELDWCEQYAIKHLGSVPAWLQDAREKTEAAISLGSLDAAGDPVDPPDWMILGHYASLKGKAKVGILTSEQLAQAEQYSLAQWGHSQDWIDQQKQGKTWVSTKKPKPALAPPAGEPEPPSVLGDFITDPETEPEQIAIDDALPPEQKGTVLGLAPDLDQLDQAEIAAQIKGSLEFWGSHGGALSFDQWNWLQEYYDQYGGEKPAWMATAQIKDPEPTGVLAAGPSLQAEPELNLLSPEEDQEYEAQQQHKADMLDLASQGPGHLSQLEKYSIEDYFTAHPGDLAQLPPDIYQAWLDKSPQIKDAYETWQAGLEQAQTMELFELAQKKAFEISWVEFNQVKAFLVAHPEYIDQLPDESKEMWLVSEDIQNAYDAWQQAGQPGAATTLEQQQAKLGGFIDVLGEYGLNLEDLEDFPSSMPKSQLNSAKKFFIDHPEEMDKLPADVKQDWSAYPEVAEAYIDYMQGPSAGEEEPEEGLTAEDLPAAASVGIDSLETLQDTLTPEQAIQIHDWLADHPAEIAKLPKVAQKAWIEFSGGDDGAIKEALDQYTIGLLQGDPYDLDPYEATAAHDWLLAHYKDFASLPPHLKDAWLKYTGGVNGKFFQTLSHATPEPEPAAPDPLSSIPNTILQWWDTAPIDLDQEDFDKVRDYLVQHPDLVDHHPYKDLWLKESPSLNTVYYAWKKNPTPPAAAAPASPYPGASDQVAEVLASSDPNSYGGKQIVAGIDYLVDHPELINGLPAKSAWMTSGKVENAFNEWKAKQAASQPAASAGKMEENQKYGILEGWKTKLPAELTSSAAPKMAAYWKDHPAEFAQLEIGLKITWGKYDKSIADAFNAWNQAKVMAPASAATPTPAPAPAGPAWPDLPADIPPHLMSYPPSALSSPQRTVIRKYLIAHPWLIDNLGWKSEWLKGATVKKAYDAWKGTSTPAAPAAPAPAAPKPAPAPAAAPAIATDMNAEVLAGPNSVTKPLKMVRQYIIAHPELLDTLGLTAQKKMEWLAYSDIRQAVNLHQGNAKGYSEWMKELQAEQKKAQKKPSGPPPGAPGTALPHDLLKQIDMHAVEPTWKNPSGNKVRYGGVIFNDAGQVLLREPLNHYDGYHWTFPKGHQEYGDTAIETALKETGEETGHYAQAIGVVPGLYSSGHSSTAYFVMRSTGEGYKQNNETESTRWVDYEEAVKLIKQGTNPKGVERDLAVLKASFDENARIVAGKADYTHLFKDLLNAPPPPPPKKVHIAQQAPAIKLPPVDPYRPAPGFPTSHQGMKVINASPGGTTGAKFVEDPETGKKYVMKKNNRDPQQTKLEAAANLIYQAAGIRTPQTQLYPAAGGDIMLTELIEDTRSLNEVMSSGTAAEKAKVKKQLQDGFAADVLLRNWDVLGASGDNIRVDKDGTAWRVDNGGVFDIKAQGGKKELPHTEYPLELWSMRGLHHAEFGDTPAPSGGAAGWSRKIYGEMSFSQVSASCRELAKKTAEILAATPAEHQDLTAARLGHLARIGEAGRLMDQTGLKSEYQSDFARTMLYHHQAGVSETAPESLTASRGKPSTSSRTDFSVQPVDENGIPFDNLRTRTDNKGKPINTSMTTVIAKAINAAGGNYDIISTWMNAQAGSSWSYMSEALKYWFAQQNGSESRCYWKRGLAQAKQTYEDKKSVYDKQYGAGAFDRTLRLYHAATYEYLSRMELQKKTAEGMITVVRTDGSDAMSTIPGKAPQVGDHITGWKRGALESASIYNPVAPVSGTNVFVQTVPITSVMATYLVEQNPGAGGDAFLGDRENEIVVHLADMECDYVATTPSRYLEL